MHAKSTQLTKPLTSIFNYNYIECFDELNLNEVSPFTSYVFDQQTDLIKVYLLFYKQYIIIVRLLKCFSIHSSWRRFDPWNHFYELPTTMKWIIVYCWWRNTKSWNGIEKFDVTRIKTCVQHGATKRHPYEPTVYRSTVNHKLFPATIHSTDINLGWTSWNSITMKRRFRRYAAYRPTRMQLRLHLTMHWAELLAPNDVASVSQLRTTDCSLVSDIYSNEQNWRENVPSVCKFRILHGDLGHSFDVLSLKHLRAVVQSPTNVCKDYAKEIRFNHNDGIDEYHVVRNFTTQLYCSINTRSINNHVIKRWQFK